MKEINVKEFDAFFCKFFEVNLKDLKEIKRGKSFEWDSMKHVDLLLSLKENFNLKIDHKTAGKIETYEDILNVIKKGK